MVDSAPRILFATVRSLFNYALAQAFSMTQLRQPPLLQFIFVLPNSELLLNVGCASSIDCSLQFYKNIVNKFIIKI